MSQQLDPPPPIETYSVLGNLGARIFFQLLEKHKNNWDVSDYKFPKRLQPNETAIDVDIVKFLTRKESSTWKPGLDDTLEPGEARDTYVSQMYDLMRFLETAIQGIRKQSPEFQPIPPLEPPDPDYELARKFHHYFMPYRTRLSPQLLLTSASDQEVIEFILEEYNRAPISTPLTHEQDEEQQSFQTKLVMFLLSAEGKRFLSNKYARLYDDPRILKPEEQAFILLYWRYKKYWKQTLSFEQAPIAEITQFLCKYYMEYWWQQIGTHDKMDITGENEVYSIFLTDKFASNNQEIDSTDSKIDTEISQEFYTETTPCDDEFECDLDFHQDESICELCRILGTTIVAARRMSQRLDPPPPMETYSALDNLGTRMFFQLLEEHRNDYLTTNAPMVYSQ